MVATRCMSIPIYMYYISYIVGGKDGCSISFLGVLSHIFLFSIDHWIAHFLFHQIPLLI